jgi:hypothetical protein
MNSLPAPQLNKSNSMHDKGLGYFNDLETSLAEGASQNILPGTMDAFMWGYLCAHYNKLHPNVVYSKIASIVQCENENIITVDDKYFMYLSLTKKFTYTLEDYLEHKTIASRPGPILERVTSTEEEKMSQDLINQFTLEEQYETEQKRKLKEEQVNASVLCKICLEGLTTQEFMPLDGCGHMFHTPCVRDYIKAAIDSRHIPIKCPEQCGVCITQGDVYQIVQDEKSRDKYEEFELKNFAEMNSQDISWCPTADCKFLFSKEEGVSEFYCPVCTKHYCLSCKTEFHKGQTCKEWRVSNNYTESDKRFMDFVKGHKYKQCTQCKFWVEKNEGCDHMTCRCSYQFCYKCGGKYQACECMKPQIRPIPVGHRPVPIGNRPMGGRPVVGNRPGLLLSPPVRQLQQPQQPQQRLPMFQSGRIASMYENLE